MVCINFFQEILNKYGKNSEGHVDFESFVCYIVEHEKALRLSFESLDHKGDGTSSFFDFCHENVK